MINRRIQMDERFFESRDWIYFSCRMFTCWWAWISCSHILVKIFHPISRLKVQFLLNNQIKVHHFLNRLYVHVMLHYQMHVHHLLIQLQASMFPLLNHWSNLWCLIPDPHSTFRSSQHANQVPRTECIFYSTIFLFNGSIGSWHDSFACSLNICGESN